MKEIKKKNNFLAPQLDLPEVACARSMPSNRKYIHRYLKAEIYFKDLSKQNEKKKIIALELMLNTYKLFN